MSDRDTTYLEQSQNDYVAVANGLFRRFSIPTIQDLAHCPSSAFLSLYEGILGDRLKGIVRNPVSREDEIHNVQCVVDSLASDVLHCDLSHITGRSIVDGDAVTIRYLLEILEGLVDYVMEQISSGTSSEVDDFRPLDQTARSISQLRGDAGEQDDGWVMATSGTLSGTGSRARSVESLSLPSSISIHGDRDDRSETSDSTAELIKLGQESASFRGRHQSPSYKHHRESAPSYRLGNTLKNGLSVSTNDGLDITEGPLSQLTPVSPKDKPMLPQPVNNKKISSSFSSVSWPKAPSTASSPSLIFSPATRNGSQKKLDGKAFVAERVSPYNSLLSSLRGDTSILSGDRSHMHHENNTSTNTSLATGSAIEQVSDQVTRPALAGLHQHHRHSLPLAAAGAESVGSHRSQLSTSQADARRRSPRFNPTATSDVDSYPAMLPQKHTPSRTPLGNYRDSPPRGQRTATADEDMYPTATAHHYGSSSRHNNTPDDKDMVPRRTSAPTWDRDIYPAVLPQSTRAVRHGEDESAADSERGGYRLRSGGRGGSQMKSGGPSTERIEIRDYNSSLSGQMEDSYDRSYMQRKIARKRRVAFEDERTGATPDREHEEEQGGPRLRPGRDGDEELGNDTSEMLYGNHINPLGEYASYSDDEDEPSRGFGEENNDSHRYDLRPRQRVDGKRKKKGVGVKAHPKRSVLLHRSLPRRRPPLKVCFEDAMNQDAKGLMGKVRHQLAQEAKQQDRLKTVLCHSYATDLREVKRGVTNQVRRRKRVVEQMDTKYKSIHGQPKTSQYKPSKKYSSAASRPSTTDDNRRAARSTKRSPPSKRKRDASSSPTHPELGGERPLRIGDDDLLPTLMHEFPFLHVSPHTAQRMWAQQMSHMEHLTKAAISHKYKKPKSQAKIEEAEKKQEVLGNIMKKELAHNQRMREIKERRQQERLMRTKATEQRQVNARARRYYDEFRLRSQSRALKRRTKEEQIFKHLFEEGMQIQKARIHELRKYAQEKRDENTKRQQDEVDSLENYYRDQFGMLAESIAKERHQLNVMDRAQANAMKRIKDDMRLKMEREIRDYQEQLHRDEDVEYFRQLEADRMRHELQMAKYKALL